MKSEHKLFNSAYGKMNLPVYDYVSLHNILSSVKRNNLFYKTERVLSWDIYMMSVRAIDNIRHKVYFVSHVSFKVKHKLKCEVNGNTKQI